SARCPYLEVRGIPVSVLPPGTFLLLFTPSDPPRYLHSFPTRRSSDLIPFLENVVQHPRFLSGECTTTFIDATPELFEFRKRRDRDRKSTRLNSSHVKSSYAVFCLKKNMPLAGSSSVDAIAIEALNQTT